MGRLEDRVAIITGAGQGIGLSYAERFLDEGAKVVVAEINEDRAASAMEQLEKLGDAAFGQTKWGVVGLTKFLAAQLGQYNITVNCIAPGVTMTEATKKIVPEAFIDMLPAMSAMKRKLEPEDLTGTALFFASDDAALVTGQVLCVDGGSIMPA